jgi:hypothetical protein
MALATTIELVGKKKIITVGGVLLVLFFVVTRVGLVSAAISAVLDDEAVVEVVCFVHLN